MSIIVAVLGVALLTLMPIVIAMLGLRSQIKPLTHVVGTSLLIGCAGAFLIALYRLTLPSAPSKRPARGGVTQFRLRSSRRRSGWSQSSVLSFYADHIAQLGLTYGPVGAVIGLMLWLYVTFYAVLIGAELNAQLDRVPSGDSRDGERATAAVEPVRSSEEDDMFRDPASGGKRLGPEPSELHRTASVRETSFGVYSRSARAEDRGERLWRL